MLEVDILLYSNTKVEWVKQITHPDISVKIYSYKVDVENTIKIPDTIKTVGEAYNYIISNVNEKYFILLDNADYLDVDLLYTLLPRLNHEYDLIVTNKFYIEENNCKYLNVDNFYGSNVELENKIMTRKILPYFFGPRIYKTKFIVDNQIKMNPTNIFNDVYPNILVTRHVKTYLAVDIPFYTRKRLNWNNTKINMNASADLRNMLENLINLNIDKKLILYRVVDSCNYSVNIRQNDINIYIQAIQGLFDEKEFLELLYNRNDVNLYKLHV